MTFGSNIADARKALGLTQEQLADKMTVSYQAISSWERDECLPDGRRCLAMKTALSAESAPVIVRQVL